MQGPCIDLTAAVRSVQLFKINGHSALKEKPTGTRVASAKKRVGGYDWVIDFYPSVFTSNDYWIKFRVTLDSDVATGLATSFACRVVDQTGKTELSPEARAGGTFFKGQWKEVLVMSRARLATSGYVKDDSVVVECAITVLLDEPNHDQATAGDAAAVAGASSPAVSAAAPFYDLHKHFGELFLSQKGADVTFVVAGESVTAHKCVLAARSPVFMAQLFHDMKGNASPRVEVEDMEADVFRALIEFIYTDAAPELDDGHEEEEDAKAMAQHLLAAAGRYGMERLNLMCEDKVCGDVSVEVRDMDAAVFRAMLRFVYIDTAPELDREEEKEDGDAMAQHLLAAADRYRIERLKLICEERLRDGVGIDTVATTLVLAEQHGCSRLKAKCVELIAANLEGAMATDGYKHLMDSCSSVLNDLLKAMPGRMNLSTEVIDGAKIQ